MLRRISVNFGNFILSLSDAMDLANASLAQHQQRTAFVVWELGNSAHLSKERLEKIFMAALLHDIGALSLEEKISLRASRADNIEDHCIRGELLFDNVPWLRDISPLIRFHHQEWRNWKDSIDSPTVFDSQLLFLADHLERLINRDEYILHQHEDIIRKIVSLSGSLFHPRIIDLFLASSDREEFWLDLVSPRLYSLLLNNGPFRKIEVDFNNILSMSELFRNIIDFRSRFTSTHSSGVAAAGSMLAKIFGLSESEVNLMEVAGNLHDIGKLAIPNSILEKPGGLTKEEMAVMKSHTYYTYSIIKTIGGMQQIAEWAAYHHEKLDGSGYPFHCREGELDIGARILTVADIFTALAEDRPYRKGMTRVRIVEIIRQLSDKHELDAKIVNLLFENIEEVRCYVIERQNVTRAFYENQFSSLMVRDQAS